MHILKRRRNDLQRELSSHKRTIALPTLVTLAMVLSGCMPSGDGFSSIATSSAPERVVMQLIVNSCGDDSADDSESLTTGEVKGLSKVMNGFGIPYDEYAPEHSEVPVPITDDSYEANKNRGIGYAGLESHYPGEVKGGANNHKEQAPGSYTLNSNAVAALGTDEIPSEQWNSLSSEEKEQYGYVGDMWDNLTPDEEMYGCCMRWEYAGWPSGSGIPGYYDFVRGSEGNRQYLAIHALNTDKWCICCPYDFGPSTNLPVTGSKHYGRIGGVSPETTEALGFGGHGECPDEALTEWWWVENSSQVKCGPVGDLSSLTKGSGSSSSSSSDSSASSTKTTVATELTGVTTAHTARVLTMATNAGTSSSGTSSSTGTGKVKIEPANPNSFVNKIHPDLNHGEMPKERVKYIMMHDTESGTDDASAIINAWINAGQGTSTHFMVDKQGKIFQCVAMDQTGWHSGSAGQGANAKFGVEHCDLNPTGQGSDGDNNMSWFSYGIEIVHEHEDGPYPEAQLNALDRLVAYIDDYLGFEPKIIDHKEWANQDGNVRKQDCSDDFPLESYKSSRNHNNVKTESDVEEAKANDACSDEAGEDEEPLGPGGEDIAKKAVEIAGSASPEPPISGGEHEKPTNSQLSKYVSEKERVYPNDDWWAVCCRSSATAIKASGADDDFPAGPPSAQYEYCETSPKWTKVGEWRTGDSSNSLKPGDVLIAKEDHIKIWVGNEIAKTKFPDTDGNMYQGSQNQYYPYIASESTAQDSRTYGIFRVKRSGGKVDVSDWDSLYYDQSDPQWGDHLYQSSSIAATGCGLCATAHALTILLGEEINPPTLADKMKDYANSHGGINYGDGPGTAWAGWEEVVQGLYGDQINMERVPTTTSAVRSAVDGGKMIVYNVPAGFGGIKLSNGQYRTTQGGHVMMVYKYDSGFCVKDSSGSRDGIPASCVVYDDDDFARTMASAAGHLGWCYALSNKNGLSSSSKSGKKTSKKSKKTSSKKKSSGKSGTNGATGAAKELVDKAYSIIGAGYSYSGYEWTGDVSTSVFTCSGVPDYCLGLPPRTHCPETFWKEIEDAGNFTTDISKLKTGDLVFYPYGGRSPCGHVGIYIGNNQIIDSIPNGGVQIRDVNYMTCLGGGPIVSGGGTSSGGGGTSKPSRYMFVGDSRTNQMGGYLRESLSNDFMDGQLDASTSKSPSGDDEIWIAKGSMGYPWFKDTAVPMIDQNVKSGDAIIIWMGVNGAPSYVDEYANLVNQKAKEWKAKGATVYYASVGPQNGDLARQNGMYGSDADVVQFNAGLKPKLSSDVGWIDVYAEIKDSYGTDDGVHYDQPTYQKVYDCMVRGAVGNGEEDEEEEEEEGEYYNVNVHHV